MTNSSKSASSSHPPDSSRYILGLDFGTSNTALTLYDTHTRTVLPTPSFAEPTLLFYPEEDRLLTPYVGVAAIERYVASGMRGRFFQAIKTTLPDSTFTHTIVNGIRLTLEQLLTTILRHFVGKAESFVGQRLTRVVCGRPANFSEAGESANKRAQERLHQALEKLGFTEIHFELEPIAAAYHYEATLSEPQTVLVGDFGGGTSDFTIMRLDPARRHKGDRKGDILGTAGVPVAGNRYDAALMRERLLPLFGSRAHYKTHKHATPLMAANYAHAALCAWDKIHHLKSDIKIMEFIARMKKFSDDPEAFARMEALIRQNLGYDLFRSIEAAKIDLSAQLSTTLSYDNPSLKLSHLLSRSDFEADTHEESAAILGCLDELLAATKHSPSDIEAVFLTGGTAQLPVLQSAFVERFGAHKIHSGDYFASIASGLAHAAGFVSA